MRRFQTFPELWDNANRRSSARAKALGRDDNRWFLLIAECQLLIASYWSFYA